jgi:DNA repair exonuclease SbcCD ATPase subunit
MTITGPAPLKGNPAALAQARAETAARKHRDVVTTLARAADSGQHLTVSTLASSAGVSRQFLYSRPDLMEGLRRHQEQHSDVGNAPLRAARTADLINAQSTIKRLKAEIRDLNRKLDAGLSAQIELRDEKRLRQLYEQRGHEIERLLTQNADLIRTVAQLRELSRSLEDDLTIERTALRELSGLPANVTSIRFGD